MKRQHELDNDFVYDNVLSIRSDILYRPGPPGGFQEEETKIRLNPTYKSGMSLDCISHVNGLLAPDFNWRAGAIAANLTTCAFLDTQLTDGIEQFMHGDEFHLPSLYAMKSLMGGKEILGHFKATHIRPWSISQLPFINKGMDPDPLWEQKSIYQKKSLDRVVRT